MQIVFCISSRCGRQSGGEPGCRCLFLSGCLASERDMGTLKLQLKELNETIALMQTNQAELASKMEELNQNLAVSNENLSQLDGQLFNLSSNCYNYS